MSKQKKTVLAEYHVTVYSDGSFTTEKIEASDLYEVKKSIVDNLAASPKMVYITEFLRYIIITYRNNYKAYQGIDDIAVSSLYTRAVNETAKKYNVTANSVAEKLIRQCNIKRADWLYAIKKMIIEYDCSDIINILNKNVILAKIDADLELINRFSKFYDEKYLKSKEPIPVDAELD